MKSGDCPKDYLSGAPPSVGAERTENFEKSRLLRQLEMAFPRLLSTTKAVVILSFRLQYFFHLKQKMGKLQNEMVRYQRPTLAYFCLL